MSTITVEKPRAQTITVEQPRAQTELGGALRKLLLRLGGASFSDEYFTDFLTFIDTGKVSEKLQRALDAKDQACQKAIEVIFSAHMNAIQDVRTCPRPTEEGDRLVGTPAMACAR